MASLEAGFKIDPYSLLHKIPKSRCGWSPYWGCLEFINDNMGYFEGTHVGTYLSLKKLSGLNSLVLRLLSIKPILYEKYQSSGGCSWGHVWGWDLNFSNSELLRLVVLFEQVKDCANNKVKGKFKKLLFFGDCIVSANAPCTIKGPKVMDL